MKSQIPEVVLPCDLPTWSMVQEYLVVVQAGVTSEEMIVAMLRIYDICNISGNISEEREASDVDDHKFDDFKQVIENGFSSRERERFLSRTLPCMARYVAAHRIWSQGPQKIQNLYLSNYNTLQSIYFF